MPALVSCLAGDMEWISNDSLRIRPLRLPLSSCFTLIEAIYVRQKYMSNYNLDEIIYSCVTKSNIHIYKQPTLKDNFW